MKYYFTDGDCWGYMPGKNGEKGTYKRFCTDTEYREAYEEETAS